MVEDSDGFKCLQYTEDPSGKTHQGGVSMWPHVPKIANVYPNYDNLDRCPIRLFEKHVSLLPTSRKNSSLYMHAKKKPMAKVWYLDYPLEINTITPLVKELVHSVGVRDGNDKNQSFRTTMASIPYNENQDEQLIQSFTGCRSNCVR